MKEYICKEDAINLIKGLDDPTDDDYYRAGLLEAEVGITQMVPAADVVEVVHARWYDGRCTNCCHEALDYLDDCEMKTYITKYCPDCGAKND